MRKPSAIRATAPGSWSPNGRRARPRRRSRWSPGSPRATARSTERPGHGRDGGLGGAPPIPGGERSHPHGRDRRGDRPRDHEGRQDRHREGARALRVDRGQHVPRPEGQGMRARRHPDHARDQEPGREVRRPERAVCRLRPVGGYSCARRLRDPRRRLGRVQEPGAAPATSRRRSTAGPSSTSRATAGCRWTRPTCARSCSRRSRAACRSTIRRCRRRAPSSSAPGR